MIRDTAFTFTPEEISMWSSTTQAVAKLADAHFNLFNELEASKAKGVRARNALGSLDRAAKHLRTTCNKTECAYWEVRS